MSLSDVATAVDALETALTKVSGAPANTRFYAPMSAGSFLDALDDLHDRGWTIEHISPRRAHVSDAAALYNLASDEDQTVAQLLSGQEAWADIERALKAHGVAGDDAPADDAKPQTKLVWLKAQAERVQKAAEKFRDNAEDMASDEAREVKDAGRKAVQTVTKTAQALKRGTLKPIQIAAQKVINTVKGAAETAAWGAAIPVGLFVIAGLIIYASASSGRTQRRYEGYRKTFVQGARDAGVL